MTRFSRILLAALWCVGLPPVVAEGSRDAVVIAGFPKEGRLEQDGTGHYADMVRAFLAESDQPASFVIMPVMRTIRTFTSGRSICMVPAAFERWRHHAPDMKREDVLESEPIDYVTAHIVTRRGDPVITDLKSLNGKRISFWVGLPVDAFLSGMQIEMIAAESEVSSIRLLMSGRVDAIWSWAPDAFLLYDRMGLGTPNLVLDDPVFGSAVHILCRKTPSTAALMADIDKSIRAMRADGRLKEILGHHSRVVGVDVPLNMVEAQN